MFSKARAQNNRIRGSCPLFRGSSLLQDRFSLGLVYLLGSAFPPLSGYSIPFLDKGKICVGTFCQLFLIAGSHSLIQCPTISQGPRDTCQSTVLWPSLPTPWGELEASSRILDATHRLLSFVWDGCVLDDPVVLFGESFKCLGSLVGAGELLHDLGPNTRKSLALLKGDFCNRAKGPLSPVSLHAFLQWVILVALLSLGLGWSSSPVGTGGFYRTVFNVCLHGGAISCHCSNKAL